MRLIHEDGRTQNVSRAEYEKHERTYARGGWSPDLAAIDLPEGETVTMPVAETAPPTTATTEEAGATRTTPTVIGKEDVAALEPDAASFRPDNAPPPAQPKKPGA